MLPHHLVEKHNDHYCWGVFAGAFELRWGGVAQHQSVPLALVYSGFGTVVSAILAPLANVSGEPSATPLSTRIPQL